MDNSYFSFNLDVSPDVVRAVVWLSGISAAVYIARRSFAYLERRHATQTA